MPKAGDNVGPSNGQENSGNGNGNNSQKKKRFQGTCNCCGKFGHKEAEWRKKVADVKHRTGSKEGAAAGISGGNNVECLLCAKAEFVLMVQMEMKQNLPNLHKLLTHQPFGLVATMDMTPQDGHGKQANVKRQFECCDG